VDINRYAYAGNDPVNGSDANGHSYGSATPGGTPDNINGKESEREDRRQQVEAAQPKGEPKVKTLDEVSNKRISDLHDGIKESVVKFINKVYIDQGIQLRVVQGYRSFAEQNRLYSYGRTVQNPNPGAGPTPKEASGPYRHQCEGGREPSQLWCRDRRSKTALRSWNKED
jgi:hypothetical protein